jgi:hypothetical protein
MRSRALLTILAAVAFAALLVPGAAAARVKPASRRHHPEIGAELALVDVRVEDRRRLALSAEKFGNVLEGASYVLRIPPRRGSDDIVAGLGRLGRIDVRFVPGKVRREKPPRGCRGGDTVIERGRFVGTIAFHGEGGFTEAHGHAAEGLITRTPALTCRATKPPEDPKKLRRELEAREHAKESEKGEESEAEEEGEVLSVGLTARARGGRVTLQATKVALREKGGKSFALTNIFVTGGRRRGRIKESSFAGYLFGKGSTFLVPNRKRPASEGVLKPPAPFSGTATFRRHPAAAPTWTGDLKIDLPGFGGVRLAGPGTHAAMCEGLTCPLRGAPSARELLRRVG